MKIQKLLYTTGICCFLFLSSTAFAQNINTNPFWEGTIVMLDGTEKNGLVQVPNIAAIKKVAFKTAPKKKTEAIQRQDIARITVVSENGNTFYYDNLPFGSAKKSKVSKKRYLLLANARNNYVTFYVMCTYKVNNRTGNIDYVGKYIQGIDFPSFTHLMSKGEKTDAKVFYVSKQLGGIKKNAELYFAEDEALVQRIKNKELKGNDIPEITRTFLETTKSM